MFFVSNTFFFLNFGSCNNNNLIELIAIREAPLGWFLLCIQYDSDVRKVENYWPSGERVFGEEEKSHVVNIGEDSR